MGLGGKKTAKRIYPRCTANDFNLKLIVYVPLIAAFWTTARLFFFCWLLCVDSNASYAYAGLLEARKLLSR
jgi:hypothetical protein